MDPVVISCRRPNLSIEGIRTMKYLKTIKDEDDNIELEVYELPQGGLVGIDSNYLDQVEVSKINNPYMPLDSYPVPPKPN